MLQKNKALLCAFHNLRLNKQIKLNLNTKRGTTGEQQGGIIKGTLIKTIVVIHQINIVSCQGLVELGGAVLKLNNIEKNHCIK